MGYGKNTMKTEYAMLIFICGSLMCYVFFAIGRQEGRREERASIQRQLSHAGIDINFERINKGRLYEGQER